MIGWQENQGFIVRAYCLSASPVLKESWRFFFICMKMFSTWDLYCSFELGSTYLPLSLSKENTQTATLYVTLFSNYGKSILTFCLEDFLLLYGYLCSGWCWSASLRHYRSRGHQHNLHSGVCEWPHLHAWRCKTHRHISLVSSIHTHT